MLLQHFFANPQVNLALELFLRVIRDVLQDELESVLLHGSIVFDDLAPGYGDLDFVAVLRGELSHDALTTLKRARQPLRSGDYGVLLQMVEGAFLPRHMLDPSARGRALWWGTSGEREWETNQLGYLVLRVLHDRGIVILGPDVRESIPSVADELLLAEIAEAAQRIRQVAQSGRLHSVDWLLTIARLLYWVRERRLSSKSEAALWAVHHAHGEWRLLLPRARYVRLNPETANYRDVGQWLATLEGPIREACQELECELKT